MGWQGKERGILFKVLAGFSFLIRCQMRQRYLPNVLAMGLVLGLYSIAPRCLCPAAPLLLESVGFLWCRGCCRACVKILLLLTAGYVSGAWKSRRALSTPLAGQAVAESCNFSLATWGWDTYAAQGDSLFHSTASFITVTCGLRLPSES